MRDAIWALVELDRLEKRVRRQIVWSKRLMLVSALFVVWGRWFSPSSIGIVCAYVNLACFITHAWIWHDASRVLWLIVDTRIRIIALTKPQT